VLEPQLAAVGSEPDLAASGRLAGADFLIDAGKAASWIQSTSDRHLQLSGRGQRWAALYFFISRPLFGRAWLIYRETPSRPPFRAALEGAGSLRIEAAPPATGERLERLDLGCVDLKPGPRRLLIVLEPAPGRGVHLPTLELIGLEIDPDLEPAS
jgi:hypothetical protein